MSSATRRQLLSTACSGAGLLALNAAKPTDANAGKLADWLLAARRGSRWYPEKANGPAIAAQGEWFAKTKFAAEKYTLQVVVNGAESAPQWLEVP